MESTTKITPRHQMQRLAIAADMTLRDGSPVVLGGPKVPPTVKIVDKLRELGWLVTRMTKDQRSDARDDHGYTGRHFVGFAADFPSALAAILREPVGFRDCDGEMSVEDWLLTHIA